MKYAKEWSFAVDFPVCLWEQSQSENATGPYYVSCWKDPWPDEAVQILCAYDKGKNNGNLTFVLDDLKIDSRSHTQKV